MTDPELLRADRVHEAGVNADVVASVPTNRLHGTATVPQVSPGMVPPLTRLPHHEVALGLGALSVASVAYPLNG